MLFDINATRLRYRGGLFVTTVGLLFLAGAKLWQFFGLILTGIAAIVVLIIAEPYRMARVTGFLSHGKIHSVKVIS